MAGKIRYGNASKNVVFGPIGELLGGTKCHWDDNTLIRIIPVTNSGKPTRARLLIEITASMGLLAFSPANKPSASARGTEKTRVTPASQLECPRRSMTIG